VLACESAFAKGSDEKAMAATFGAANVRSQAVDGPEGSTLQATLVYPDNPRKRLKVLW
jgi:hypothetical protein